MRPAAKRPFCSWRTFGDAAPINEVPQIFVASWTRLMQGFHCVPPPSKHAVAGTGHSDEGAGASGGI